MSLRFVNLARHASSMGAGIFREPVLTPLAAVAAELSTQRFSTLSATQPQTIVRSGSMNDESLLALIANSAAGSAVPLPLHLCTRAVTLGLDLSSGLLSQYFDRGQLLQTLRASLDHCDVSLPDQRAALHRLLLTLMRSDVKRWLDTDQRQARRNLMMDTLGSKLRAILASDGWPPIAVCDVIYVLGKDALLWPSTATMATRYMQANMQKLPLADLARLAAGITLAPLHEDVGLLRLVCKSLDARTLKLVQQEGDSVSLPGQKEALDRLHDLALICSSLAQTGTCSVSLVDAACTATTGYLRTWARSCQDAPDGVGTKAMVQAYSCALQIARDCTLLAPAGHAAPESLFTLAHSCQTLSSVLLAQHAMPRSALPTLLLLREIAREKWTDKGMATGFGITGPYVNVRGHNEWKAKVSFVDDGCDAFSSVLDTRGSVPLQAREALYQRLRAMQTDSRLSEAVDIDASCQPFALPSGLIADALLKREGARIAILLTRHSSYMHAGVQVDSRGAPKAGAWCASWNGVEPVAGLELACHMRLAQSAGITVIPFLATELQVETNVQALQGQIKQLLGIDVPVADKNALKLSVEKVPDPPVPAAVIGNDVPAQKQWAPQAMKKPAHERMTESVPTHDVSEPPHEHTVTVGLAPVPPPTAPMQLAPAGLPMYLDITPAQLRRMHPGSGQQNVTSKPKEAMDSFNMASAAAQPADPRPQPSATPAVASSRVLHSRGKKQGKVTKEEKGVKDTALREALDLLLMRYSAHLQAGEVQGSGTERRPAERRAQRPDMPTAIGMETKRQPAWLIKGPAHEEADKRRSAAVAEKPQLDSNGSSVRYVDISPSQLHSAVLRHSSRRASTPGAQPTVPIKPKAGSTGPADGHGAMVRTALQQIMGKYGQATLTGKKKVTKRATKPAAAVTFRGLLAYWPARQAVEAQSGSEEKKQATVTSKAKL